MDALPGSPAARFARFPATGLTARLRVREAGLRLVGKEMMRRSGSWLAIALALLAAAGCGREDPPPPPKVPAENPVERAAREVTEAFRKAEISRAGEAVRQMGESLSAAVKTEPVDFRTLRDWMPATLGNLKRVSADGGRAGVAGLATSRAEAVYEGPGGARGRVEVRDAGSLSGVASLAVAWLDVKIDKEGTSGYERTRTDAGRKAYERYATATRRGDYDVIVAGRFIVGIEITGVDAKAFQEAIARLDLGGLDALAEKASAAEPKK